jgi:hypothetical protein
MTHQGVVGNFGADDLDVEKIAKTSTHLHLHSKFCLLRILYNLYYVSAYCFILF